MGRAYLIRYGLARVLGRFESTSETFERGQTVVIHTHRGTELGEVVSEDFLAATSSSHPAPILRLASPEDRERGRFVERDRAAHFDLCREVFEEGTWPIELIDAEPLFDQGRTVLHYLGPHRLDASGLIAAFRERCGLDVVLEPAGRDVPEPEPDPEPEAEETAHGCGSCGSSGGGCGSSGGGCGTGGGCAVKSLIAARRRIPVDA
jgi:PSP1 C-terminal conserved region